jgi:hypothetical protein
VKVTRFDTARDLIIVPGRVWNPNSNDALDLRLVLDTGAAETIVAPELLDELGYSAGTRRSDRRQHRHPVHGERDGHRASAGTKKFDDWVVETADQFGGITVVGLAVQGLWFDRDFPREANGPNNGAGSLSSSTC